MAGSTTTKWSTIKRAETPERRERIDAIKRAVDDVISLSELRSRKGLTQVELASRLAISQGNVSELERRDDVYLSSLTAYVEGMGGELALVARFPDGETYPLKLGPQLEVKSYAVSATHPVPHGTAIHQVPRGSATRDVPRGSATHIPDER